MNKKLVISMLLSSQLMVSGFLVAMQKEASDSSDDESSDEEMTVVKSAKKTGWEKPVQLNEDFYSKINHADNQIKNKKECVLKKMKVDGRYHEFDKQENYDGSPEDSLGAILNPQWTVDSKFMSRPLEIESGGDCRRMTNSIVDFFGMVFLLPYNPVHCVHNTGVKKEEQEYRPALKVRLKKTLKASVYGGRKKGDCPLEAFNPLKFFINLHSLALGEHSELPRLDVNTGEHHKEDMSRTIALYKQGFDPEEFNKIKQEFGHVE